MKPDFAHGQPRSASIADQYSNPGELAMKPQRRDERRERQGRAYLPCASTTQLARGRRTTCKDRRRADIPVRSKQGSLPDSSRLWSWGAFARYCGQECPCAAAFTALLLCAHRVSAVRSALGKSARAATISRDKERLECCVSCQPPL